MKRVQVHVLRGLGALKGPGTQGLPLSPLPRTSNRSLKEEVEEGGERGRRERKVGEGGGSGGEGGEGGGGGRGGEGMRKTFQLLPCKSTLQRVWKLLLRGLKEASVPKGAHSSRLSSDLQPDYALCIEDRL